MYLTNSYESFKMLLRYHFLGDTISSPLILWFLLQIHLHVSPHWPLPGKASSWTHQLGSKSCDFRLGSNCGGPRRRWESIKWVRSGDVFPQILPVIWCLALSQVNTIIPLKASNSIQMFLPWYHFISFEPWMRITQLLLCPWWGFFALYFFTSTLGLKIFS